MEEGGETRNVGEPLPQEHEPSTMEEKALETLEVTDTGQCESAAVLGDSHVLGDKSMAEVKDDEAVAEEKVSDEGTGMQTEAGDRVLVPEMGNLPPVGDKSVITAEADINEGGVEKYVSELDDSHLVGDKDPSVDRGGEALVEIPTVSAEIVGGHEESGLGKVISELDDTKIFGANSQVDMDCGEALMKGENLAVDTDVEMKCQAEGVEGAESKSVSGLDELPPEGVEAPAMDMLVVEEEIQRADTGMEMGNEIGSVKNEVRAFDSELEQTGLLGADSSIAAEDEDGEGMAEEGAGMEGTEIETNTEVATEMGAGSSSAPPLDNLLIVGAGSPVVSRYGNDGEQLPAEEDTPLADTEMETETDVAEMTEAEKGASGGSKRKRGRSSKVPAKASARKATEEDVCFICFDGGDLVLCDRRGCPKAYHPSCVNRDEAFFRAKGRWNCGWHLCSICEKNAHYMCYTCTFSLCKACIKDAIIFCVRGSKGFCEACMKTVMLIENNEQVNKEDQVDFDDKTSWMYLFKDYWTDLKAKLSLSSTELAQAKNPWKAIDAFTGKRDSLEVFDASNDQGSGSDSSENLEASKRKRKKTKKRLKSVAKEEHLPSSTTAIAAEGSSTPGNAEWASKELLEFVMHMKNGDKSVLSQFDVQALLLEYIKSNKLRDPRRKSQIICDARLQNLFGKARVGHFEMLKLLESHFLIKEDSQIDDIQGSVVDTEVNELDADGTIDASMRGSKDRKRRTRRKSDERGPQSNLDDYAAIDMHNINLIYLRRKLVEDLLEDIDMFHDKVVGTFVRIRISGSNQKQDIYRLVQVIGLSKAAEPYKVGKKATDLVLEILNLNKTETVLIDTISNQEFTEDECKRLRQSIKCGLINRLTVGEILDKAMEIQAARVNDWLESEIVRFSHLRDRASEKGHRKELRECVEKLQLLKTPEERRRRLEEIPEIHADPHMDPSYESEDNDSEMEDNKQEIYTRQRGSGFSRKGREPVSPHRGSFPSADSWGSTRKSPAKNWESSRSISSKDFLNKSEEAAALIGEVPYENASTPGRDKGTQQSDNVERVNLLQNSHSSVRSESFSGAALETSQASLTAGAAETASVKVSETEKMWHYQDPSGKVQGPFSIVQLRKWNNNRYFPDNLRIWRTTEQQDDSILLRDALAGRFHKEVPLMDNNFTKVQTMHGPLLSSANAGKAYGASLQQGREGEGGERLNFDQSHGAQSLSELSSSALGTLSVETPKLSADRWSSDYSRNDLANLPSPTPKPSTPGWIGGQVSESKWSSNSFRGQQVGSILGVDSFKGGSGSMHSSTIVASDSHQFTPPPSSSINQNGSKEHLAVESLGVSPPASALTTGRQFLRSYENESSSSLPLSNPAPNPEQGILVGSMAGQATSQTIVSGESHGMQPPVETQGRGAGFVQKQEIVAPSPMEVSNPQAWNGAAPQPAAFGHWGGVPSTVQNPSGNVSNPGFTAFAQSDPWRPPVAVNQTSIQPAAPPTIPWVPVQGNPSMGWGGPAPGTANMNWGAAVQGPVPGMFNPAWVAATGNPGAMVQGLPPGNANLGWAAQTGNPGAAVPGPPPMNGNPGWVNPTGNPEANVQGPPLGNVNPVWGTQTGNPATSVQGPAPGNANPNWGAPPANSGMWGNEKHNGDRFSGQRHRGSQGRPSGFGGGRPWNRQPSFGSGGQNMICKFHQSGHCKKGAHCDHPHS
ncbi:zinc finger CCCH domain-containing protein 19 [Diospyros lotus]|uniref:zinc finger CCCH domain-containing protein 19 n=1 Tax=Diospyros lotus TaxID=55363 RepID=UPI00225781BF|nr:zinc finger CCCH domain-containing protein 19 [Diospyros lotus]